MQNSFYSNTELIGLIGYPIKQSFSPFIHNIAAEITGSKIIYLPFEVHSSNLKNAVKGSVALGLKGFNVTVPHKVRVVDYINKLSEEAAVIGSVNTVVNELGKLIGYNTFYKPSKIFLVNRTEQHAETLKQHFKSKMKFDGIVTKELNQPDLINILNNCSLIVNSTPVGMYPSDDDSIFTTPEIFKQDQIVFDLVYNPIKTKFLQFAESQKAITINGLNMLVQQAAKSFTLWTGNEFPTEKVYKSLLLYVTK